MRCPIDWQKGTSLHTTNQHKVGMTVKNDRLTIEPTARPRYTLDELRSIRFGIVKWRNWFPSLHLRA